jgi:hypothetical protein
MREITEGLFVVEAIRQLNTSVQMVADREKRSAARDAAPGFRRALPEFRNPGSEEPPEANPH